MASRNTSFFRKFINTDALFWGEVRNPEELRYPTTLLYFAMGLLLSAVVIAIGLFVTFLAPSPLEITAAITTIKVENCYVRVYCEESRVLRSTFVAVKTVTNVNGSVFIDGTGTFRCEMSLCLVAGNLRQEPLEFDIINSVIDLTAWIGPVDHHVSIHTNDDRPESVSKVFFGSTQFADLSVNMTKGIVHFGDTKATSAHVRLTFGSVFVTSRFTSDETFVMSADVANNNYCVSPKVALVPSTDCYEAVLLNGSYVERRCPLYTSFTGADNSSAMVHSHFHVYATALYISEYVAADGSSPEARVPGEGMLDRPTMDPDTIYALNHTAVWEAVEPISTSVQAIEVVTPALGTIFLLSSNRIITQLNPDWVAFTSLFVLRPQYRNIPTLLTHYECPESASEVFLNDGMSTTDKIDISLKELASASRDELQRLVEAHFPIRNQYLISRDIFTYADKPKATVVFSHAATELPATGGASPRAIYIHKEFVRNADGNPEVRNVRQGWIAITIIVLQVLIAAGFIVIVFWFIVRFADEIAQSYLLVRDRGIMRNAVGYVMRCPHSYFLCTLSVTTWVSFRCVIYVERSVFTWLFGDSFHRFMNQYFECVGTDLDENRSATQKLSRVISIDSIKTQYERWCLLRFSESHLRMEDVCQRIDTFGGRRVVDDKFVVLGLAPRGAAKKAFTFALDLGSLQNFYRITNDEKDFVTVDDMFVRAVVNDPSITEEIIIRRLKEWKFTVVLRPTNIVLRIRYKAYSREGLLADDVVAGIVARSEMSLSATPGYFFTILQTSGPTSRKRRFLKGMAVYLLELIIVLIVTAGPFLAAVLLTLLYDEEYYRYTTTNSVLTVDELPTSLAGIIFRPREHSWLSTIVCASALIFACLATIEPLLVLCTYHLVPRFWQGNWKVNIALLPRILVSTVIFGAYVVLILFLLFYVASVMIWWVLGAIIEPNTMLVFAASVYTFLFIMYNTWSNWSTMCSTVTAQLQRRVLEEILALIRRTPANEVFGGGARTPAGDLAAVPLNPDFFGSLTQAAMTSKGVDTGILLDLISADAVVQQQAVAQICAALKIPECAIYLPMAIITKRKSDVTCAVQTTFDELNLPMRFAPLTTQLVYHAVDLPVSAAELAHGFYTLVPEYYDVLVQHDDTITELIHAALARQMDTTSLTEVITSVGVSQLSRILDLPSALITDIVGAIRSAYQGDKARCLSQTADVLIELQPKIATESPRARTLYHVMVEIALMACGRPHCLKDALLNVVKSSDLLATHPLFHVIEPLFDGTDSARPAKPADSQNVSQIAQYFGRLVMKLTEIEFLLTPMQHGVLRELFALVKGDVTRIDNLDQRFRYTDTRLTFDNALRTFQTSRELLLLRGELLYVIAVEGPLDISAVDQNALMDRKMLDSLLQEHEHARGKAHALVDRIERLEEAMLFTYQRQRASGESKMSVEMWIADQWTTIAATSCFAPVIPDGWCDYEVFERRASVPREALKLLRYGAALVRELVTTLIPVNLDHLHAVFCHHILAAGNVAQLEESAALKAFLDESVTVSGGLQVSPRSVLELIRELCSFVFESQHLESASQKLVSRRLGGADIASELAAQAEKLTSRKEKAALLVEANQTLSFTPDFMFDIEALIQHRIAATVTKHNDISGTIIAASLAKQATYAARVRGAIAKSSVPAAGVIAPAAAARPARPPADDADTSQAQLLSAFDPQHAPEEGGDGPDAIQDMTALVLNAQNALNDSGDIDELPKSSTDEDEEEKRASVTTLGASVVPVADNLDDAQLAMVRVVRQELMRIFSQLVQPREVVQRRQELTAGVKHLATVLLREGALNLDTIVPRSANLTSDKVEVLDSIVDYAVDRSTRAINSIALGSILEIDPDAIDAVLMPQRALSIITKSVDMDASLDVIVQLVGTRQPVAGVLAHSEASFTPFCRRIGLRDNTAKYFQRLYWAAVPGTGGAWYGDIDSSELPTDGVMRLGRLRDMYLTYRHSAAIRDEESVIRAFHRATRKPTRGFSATMGTRDEGTQSSGIAHRIRTRSQLNKRSETMQQNEARNFLRASFGEVEDELLEGWRHYRHLASLLDWLVSNPWADACSAATTAAQTTALSTVDTLLTETLEVARYATPWFRCRVQQALQEQVHEHRNVAEEASVAQPYGTTNPMSPAEGVSKPQRSDDSSVQRKLSDGERLWNTIATMHRVLSNAAAHEVMLQRPLHVFALPAEHSWGTTARPGAMEGLPQEAHQSPTVTLPGAIVESFTTEDLTSPTTRPPVMSNNNVGGRDQPGGHHTPQSAAQTVVDAFDDQDALEGKDAEAFRHGSPFLLLRPGTAASIKHLFGALHGICCWYATELPAAFSALITATVQRRQTCDGAVDVLSAVFPMKVRRLVAEVVMLAMQRVRSPVLAVADQLNLSVSKLNKLRALFFSQDNDVLDLSGSDMDVTSRSLTAAAVRGYLVHSRRVRARVSRTRSKMSGANASSCRFAADGVWLAILRQVAEGNLFALLHNQYLVSSGLAGIALMSSPSPFARRLIGSMFEDNVTVQGIVRNAAPDQELFQSASAGDEVLPRLRQMVMTFRPSLAPAMHMFIGALHLYRAQYGEAVKELDCACDPAASEPEQNVHQAVVRIGVMIARLIIEEGHVNDVGAVLQACAAILRVFDALVRDSMSGSSADFQAVDFAKNAVPFLLHVLKKHLRVSVPQIFKHRQEANCRPRQEASPLQLTTTYAVIDSRTASATSMASRQYSSPKGAKDSSFDIRSSQAIEELFSEELELGLLALNAILPVLAKASSSSILTQVQMSETVTNDVIGLLKALVESITSVSVRHANLPEAMAHVVTLLRKCFDLRETISELRKSSPRTKRFEVLSETMTNLDAESATRTRIVLGFAEKLVGVVEELHDGGVTGAQMFVRLLRFAVNLQNHSSDVVIVSRISETTSVAVPRKTLLTPEEHARIELVLSVACGNFAALSELVVALGVDISADVLARLQFILKTVTSIRSLAEGKVDLRNITANDVLEMIAAQIFKELDTNSSGTLSFEEFSIALGRMKLTLSEAEARQWFDEMDTNGSGSLSFAEFQETIKRVRERFIGRIKSRLHLDRESMYVALVFLAVWVAFVLAFIILGAYGFSDGAIFTAVITGAMPLFGVLTTIRQADFSTLTARVDEAVAGFFRQLESRAMTKRDM
jgi:hypothetical protein